jgi:hypothetical protein
MSLRRQLTAGLAAVTATAAIAVPAASASAPTTHLAFIRPITICSALSMTAGAASKFGFRPWATAISNFETFVVGCPPG